MELGKLNIFKLLVKYGTPQGTIFGYMLSILYLNDIINADLSNRTKCLKWENEISSDTVVKCGVPQGTVFGALIVYTVLVCYQYTVSHSKFKLFIRDTMIYVSGNKISNWFNI